MRLQRKSIRARTIFALALFAAALAPLSSAQAWTYNVIYHFCSIQNCADGSHPETGLTIDSAGNLYGTTRANGAGTVFQLVPNGTHTKWALHRLHHFGGYPNGYAPKAEVILDSTANVYGTTASGGTNNTGTAFELRFDGSHPKRKILYSFSGSPLGGQPLSPLTYQGAGSGAPYDGASPLFGTTFFGGSASCSSGIGCGAAFRLTRDGDTWHENTIYKFCSMQDCADGQHPTAGLIVDASGNLFGVTQYGGLLGGGTAFELTEQSGIWSATVLYSFCSTEPHCADGALPVRQLVIDSAGNLFGTTFWGGAQRQGCCGVIFRLAPDGAGSQYSVLHNFCSLRKCKDGARPYSNLILDASGDLYGTTTNGGGHNIDVYNLGGGTVFKLSGSTLETLHAFCSEKNCRDGEYPYGGVVTDPAGNLFGTTEYGGKYGKGVIFELSP